MHNFILIKIIKKVDINVDGYQHLFNLWKINLREKWGIFIKNRTMCQKVIRKFSRLIWILDNLENSKLSKNSITLSQEISKKWQKSENRQRIFCCVEWILWEFLSKFQFHRTVFIPFCVLLISLLIITRYWIASDSEKVLFTRLLPN